MGPLVIPVALNAARTERPSVAVLTTGASGHGPIDVLVGLDGSPESQEAVNAAVDLLNGQIGRLRLVSVLAFDAASSPAGRVQYDDAETLLTRHAQRVEVLVGRPPDCLLLTGEPSHALREHAGAEGFDLIVVGSRGRGASRALLGSVATRLAGSGGVPVLVVSTRVVSG